MRSLRRWESDTIRRCYRWSFVLVQHSQTTGFYNFARRFQGFLLYEKEKYLKTKTLGIASTTCTRLNLSLST